MQQAVRKNFEEKVSYVARTVDSMTVNDQSSFLSVDSGLPSDTFNVVVVRDMYSPAELLANIDHFTTKGFPLAVWYWENDIKPEERSMLIQHGLTHAETNTAMCVDLSTIQVVPTHVAGLEIKHVVTASDLLEVGRVLAAGFGGSEEGDQVLAYFQRLSEHSPDQFPAMRHYIGRLHGTAIATGTLFIGSETVGIYDIVTHSPYRRRGIGSAMFQHLLEDARHWKRRFGVLQASSDGLGIYLRSGFRPAGNVYVFETRSVL